MPTNRTGGEPVVLLVDPDPYLAFLVAADVPGAHVCQDGSSSPEPVLVAKAPMPRAERQYSRATLRLLCLWQPSQPT